MIDSKINNQIILLEQLILELLKNEIIYPIDKQKNNYAINYKKLNSINENSFPSLFFSMQKIWSNQDLKFQIIEFVNNQSKSILKKQKNYIVEAIIKLLYIKDTRSLKKLYLNVLKGWREEDNFISECLNENIYIKKIGNDSDRNFSWFSFAAKPDFLINDIFKVEYQEGNNHFFKFNKLKNNVQNYILFKDKKLGYHLFIPSEIIELLNSKEEKSYGKIGRKFDFKKYKWSFSINISLKELRIISDSKNKKSSTQHYYNLK